MQLAPVKGVGDVSWKTPIVKNSMEVPLKEKVDLLMSVNGAAMKAGAGVAVALFIGFILWTIAYASRLVGVGEARIERLSANATATPSPAWPTGARSTVG